MVKKRKKKKREYPLNLYCVEYSHTVESEVFVKAESEGHARQIVEDNEAYPVDQIESTEINKEDIPDGEPILNENGNFE